MPRYDEPKIGNHFAFWALLVLPILLGLMYALSR